MKGFWNPSASVPAGVVLQVIMGQVEIFRPGQSNECERRKTLRLLLPMG